MCFHLVDEKSSADSVSFATAGERTLVVLLSLVDSAHVRLQVTLVGEPAFTPVARERPFAGMGLLVLRLFVRCE